MAIKKGVELGDPYLLEPLMTVDIYTPNEFGGDVVGDLTAKRGKILNMQNQITYQCIQAEVPMMSLFRYATSLRSLSQGRADFSMKFATYQELPKNLMEEHISKVRGVS